MSHGRYWGNFDRSDLAALQTLRICLAICPGQQLRRVTATLRADDVHDHSPTIVRCISYGAGRWRRHHHRWEIGAGLTPYGFGAATSYLKRRARYSPSFQLYRKLITNQEWSHSNSDPLVLPNIYQSFSGELSSPDRLRLPRQPFVEIGNLQDGLEVDEKELAGIAQGHKLGARCELDALG